MVFKMDVSRLARLTFASALLAFALGACTPDPMLRADSEKNFRRSLERIASGMSAEGAAALDEALRRLVEVRALRAEFEATLSFGGWSPAEPNLRAATRDWSSARASIVVRNIGRLVDGRSAAEIVKLAERETTRYRAVITEFADRPEFAAQTWPPEPALRPLSEQDHKALARIVIEGGGGLAYAAAGFGRPVLTFVVENGSDTPLRTLTLSTAGNEDDESAQIFEYSFLSPLAPGARQRIITARALEGPVDRASRVTLRVVGLRGADGRTIGASPAPAPQTSAKASEAAFFALALSSAALAR